MTASEAQRPRPLRIISVRYSLPERDADDQELDEERGQQAEVRQDPDLGIVGDEEILG